MSHSSEGSLWHRWDLHFHTPSSYDYHYGGATNQEIVDALVAEGVRVVAITDHHRIDVDRIRDLQRLGSGRLTVLPGIELRSELGGQSSIHFIGVFAEDCNVEDVWTKLSAQASITASDVRDRGDDRVYCDLAQTAKRIHELGGIVTIHAHGKSNSIEEIGNTPVFKQQVKTDLLTTCINVLELGNPSRQADYLNIVFPAIGQTLPMVIGSDNHDIRRYAAPAPCWIRSDPTFRGLLMAIREPRGRVYLGERPAQLVRLAQSGTKYIRSLEFTRQDSCPREHKWFHGRIPLNPGLVAIVGNKGSGKSALADTLGLLGCTRNSLSFSFLSRERFLHPASGLAQHFEAVVTWQSGETIGKRLLDGVKPEEPERVRYLPQDHVESVCNEVSGIGEHSFEGELKSVIFSHVPEAQRLGQSTLDDLVQFQTAEKQHRVDALLKTLREHSRERARLELQGDPVSKRKLAEQVEQMKLEVSTHIAAKPAEVPNPAVGGTGVAVDAVMMERLGSLEESRKRLLARVEEIAAKNRAASRRRAVADRLIERVGNFQKEAVAFAESLLEDATELGLSANKLVSWQVDASPVEQTRREAIAEIESLAAELNGIEPAGIQVQLVEIQKEITEISGQLDAPNQAYQAYLVDLEVWDRRRKELEGDETQPESLAGLQATLSGLEELPERIKEVRDKQVRIALEIWQEKRAQAGVYQNLYGPVQDFINTHAIAKDRLRLEFRADLTSDGFPTRLLTFLSLNKRGSFMGIDEGRARAQSLIEVVKWDEAEAVKRFLTEVDDALHQDRREGHSGNVQLKDQVAKSHKAEDLFDFLYGLEYVEPRYLLRWEGKELSMLSPGERGALLLVFYLLVDRSDLPLVIDQPEGNLDNHTVAKMLVECIKEARERRQVIIVTHNPNLAVVCDADQVIHVSMDKTNGNQITYSCGSLENREMIEFVTDVLEGTRWAFDVRGGKYAIA